jgi:hypothetical protein
MQDSSLLFICALGLVLRPFDALDATRIRRRLQAFVGKFDASPHPRHLPPGPASGARG